MRPRSLLLLLGLLAPLTACGGLERGPSGNDLPGQSTATVVQGAVLFPPLAGTATLTSDTGKQRLPVMTMDVQADGSYSLTLPESPPTGASSGVPATLWQSGMPLFCQGRPVLSDPAAQLLVVDGGFYSTGQQRIGELSPQPTALGNDAGLVITLKLLAYADRPATVQGALNCTVGSKASDQTAQVTLDYRFKRGWNTVVVRSELPVQSSELNIRGYVTPLQGTTWKFLPTSP